MYDKNAAMNLMAVSTLCVATAIGLLAKPATLPPMHASIQTLSAPDSCAQGLAETEAAAGVVLDATAYSALEASCKQAGPAATHPT
jgi:hypothetical protein